MTADMSVMDRMVLAVERVRDRLEGAVAILEAAGVSYAVAGGNAVAAWVASVDPASTTITSVIRPAVAPATNGASVCTSARSDSRVGMITVSMEPARYSATCLHIK